MRPSAEARLGVGALLGLQLLTSVSGVALLGRTGPVIERIMDENVASTEAVEDMLAELGYRRGPTRFDAALLRARSNITEPDERRFIAVIDQERAAALAGDARARGALIGALRELGAVNRRSIARTERAATRLGLAGAWAMSLLGFFGFLMGLWTSRRVRTRLIAPISEVATVLSAVRAGDTLRRCAASGTSTEEHRLVDNLNWVLDRARASRAPAGDPVARACVVGLLERWGERPVLVVERTGVVAAANRVALQQLAGEDSVGAVARRVAAGDTPAGWSASPLGDDLVLVEGPAPTHALVSLP